MDNKKQSKITNFFDEYRFLSNFWMCNIEYEGIKYPSVEHAYQAAKTNDKEKQMIIAKLSTAVEAKKYGRILVVRKDWDDIKLEIMYTLVKKKFANNNILKRQLLATGDAILVEGNTWGDVFWGVCNGVGENHLGKILMKVRQELLDEY